jgi:hypothetical protein
VIRVAASQLGDPLRLLATLAHELALGQLIGRGLLDEEPADVGGVADLLSVFLGAGVFGANATISESYGQVGHVGWWVISRHGYLPARVFGYALALFAFVRGDEETAWTKHLRPDAAAAFRQGLSYLDRTGDTLFHPDIAGKPRRPVPAAEQVIRLESGSPSVRLATLWEIEEQPSGHSGLIGALIACLEDPDPAIPGQAARCLAALGAPAVAAVPRLLGMLGSVVNRTRAGAAHALGMLAADSDALIPELQALLRDHSPEVVAEAATALARFGTRAEGASESLLRALEVALIEWNQPLIDALAGALLAVTADAWQKVGEYFRDRDPELRRLARDVLREQRWRRNGAGRGAETLRYPSTGSAEEKGFTGIG